MADSDTKSRVREQFGANAAAYATSAVHAQGASLKRVVELVQPQPHWRALDVATAAGHTAFAVAPHVAHVLATDLTPEMIPVAQSVAAQKEITNVSFETADAEALSFADASFDLVTCRIAPHHFPHINRFVEGCYRVLRQGGLLVVVDNVVPGGGAGSAQAEAGQYVNDFEKLRDPSHHRCLSLDEWESTFAAAGFAVTHTEIAPKRMVFLPWAERMGASPETIDRLRSLLTAAPADAAAFFRVEPEGDDDIAFILDEAIVIGKK